jgi:hypothetical protein
LDAQPRLKVPAFRKVSAYQEQTRTSPEVLTIPDFGRAKAERSCSGLAFLITGDGVQRVADDGRTPGLDLQDDGSYSKR